MNTSQPMKRRARLSGTGHGALIVILAGCAALFGVRGTASAQTDADGSNTIWSATMIVGDTTITEGAVTIDEQGFYEGSLGSLSSTAFSYENTDYTVVELLVQQFEVGDYVSRPTLFFRIDPGVFPAAAEDRIALVLDGTRFPLAVRPSYHVSYYAFKDPGLSWSDGDTVDVKLIDDAPPPLTASFSRMPDSHSDAAFTFGLLFSEEVENLGSATLMGAFDVTGGTVQNALAKGSTKAWDITVDPNSARDTVRITLPETTDCSAAGAICAAGERPLSHSVSDTVAGPLVVPSLSVSDASATEGNTVKFTVSLSEATSEEVAVAYATSGGTATSAGVDFTQTVGRLVFEANQTSQTVDVWTTEDTLDEEDETFTLTLSSPTNATLGDATATGTILDDDAPPLTASFSNMPATHTGAAFTFGLTFSEEPHANFSYVTLRDDAFEVTGGEVRKAKRKQQGSNRGWDITVAPASANDTVRITLPETTNCDATGAICTGDGRMLSEAVSDTVLPAASSSDMANGDAETDALAVLDGVTPEAAAAALVGEAGLSEAQLDALDRLGNRNGIYDLGDALSWRDRCRTGEADCGGEPTGPGAATSGLLLFGGAAAGRRRRSGRVRLQGSGRRPAPSAGPALAALLAAALGWSCAGDLAGPPAAEPDPDPPSSEQPVPLTAAQGPGFLNVEWTAPAPGRAIGVLLELEGPGIEGIAGARGLEIYRSGADGRHRIVVAGNLDPGPLVRFRVPDRGRLSLYRVRVLQITGEDYGLRDLGGYRAVISPH